MNATASVSHDGNQFFVECAKQAFERLAEIGCKVDKTAKPEEIVTMYFGIKRRLITKQPRRVLMAMNLKVPVEHEASFREIVLKAEAGRRFDRLPKQTLSAKAGQRRRIVKRLGSPASSL